MIVRCVCQGYRALMGAAFEGFAEVMGMLIKRGADINLQANDVSSADWVYQRLIIVLCMC